VLLATILAAALTDHPLNAFLLAILGVFSGLVLVILGHENP
jgi:hypothetical protein